MTTPAPRELRPPPAHFTGRAEELAELDRIAHPDRQRDGPAVAVICGPGGVGKSALALQWLHRHRDRYRDGQLYVDLGSERTVEPVSMGSVLGRILRAFGMPAERVPPDIGEAAALFRSITADKRVAVLVDNPASAAQVRTVLPASRENVVVVASRWRLGGLVMDGAEFVTLAPLDVPASIELLARVVGAARVSAEPDAATSFVELCAGMPIAVLTAGARLAMRPHRPIARMVAELSDDQRRLATLSVERDVSVHRVFDLSYRELSAPAARAYRWVGLHPGPAFTAEVAAAALATTPEQAADLLDTLVDASLLEVDATDRYHFHDLIRLHAQQCVELEDPLIDQIAIVRRILTYYLAKAAAADLVAIPMAWRLGPIYQQQEEEPAAYPTGVSALDGLEAELPNLMAALRAAAEYGLDDIVWQLAEAMWPVFLYRKHFPDWMATYRLGVAAADRCGNHPAKSRMHRLLGVAFHNLRRSEEAHEQGVAALEAARAAGLDRAESEALNLIGMANRARRRFDEAITTLRQAVDLDFRAGLQRHEALSRRRLGQTLSDAGRVDEAVDELQRARDRAAAVPDTHVEANTMVWLAEALARAGRAAEALDTIREAWSMLSESGSDQYRAQVLMVWGETAERLDDLTTARDLLTKARDLFAEIGAPHEERVQVALDRVEERLTGCNVGG